MSNLDIREEKEGDKYNISPSQNTDSIMGTWKLSPLNSDNKALTISNIYADGTTDLTRFINGKEAKKLKGSWRKISDTRYIIEVVPQIDGIETLVIAYDKEHDIIKNLNMEERIWVRYNKQY